MLANLRRQADGAALAISPALLLSGLEILLILGLGVAAARLIWTIATPVDPLGNWQASNTGRQSVDASVMGRFDPFFRASGDGGAARVSTLSLTLLGTRVDMVSGRGSAIIATPDGLQSSFLIGETIAPGVTLRAVGFDDATLATDAGEEKLFIDQSAGGTPVTPPDQSGSPSQFVPITAATAPPPRLAADVSVVPRMKGTDITGFVLAPRGSGKAFSAAGLQPGDVLVSVDGAPVSSIRDPATLVQRLDAGGVSVGVERGGEIVSLQIRGNR